MDARTAEALAKSLTEPATRGDIFILCGVINQLALHGLHGADRQAFVAYLKTLAAISSESPYHGSATLISWLCTPRQTLRRKKLKVVESIFSTIFPTGLPPWTEPDEAPSLPVAPSGHPEHDPAMPDPITRTELDAKLDALRADTRASVVELRGEMREGFEKLRGEMERLGRTFAEDRTANVKWMVALAGASITILGSLISFTNRPQPAMAQAPATPTVIYVSPPTVAQQQPAPMPPAPAASR